MYYMVYRESFRAKVISAGKEEVVNCLQQGVQGRKAAMPCWVQSVCGSGVVPGRAVQGPCPGLGTWQQDRAAETHGWVSRNQPRFMSSGSACCESSSATYSGVSLDPK